MYLSQERKKGKNQAKNTESEKDAAVPSEEERNYGIDRLNLGKNKNYAEDDSKLENESENVDDLGVESEWLLAKCMELHMVNKKDKSNSNKREYNLQLVRNEHSSRADH